MAKAVFRPGEITLMDARVLLDPPGMPSLLERLAPAAAEPEEVEELGEEYTGPTVEELRREAEAFKAQWGEEREALISAARAEAEGIIKEAERTAFQEVKRKTDQAQAAKQRAEEEAERLVAEARENARRIEEDARAAFDKDRKEAEDQGREAGREAGYAEGKAEVDRLVERTQTVLERAQEKRSEILAETEQQVIDLVLLIARKVIKVISENQRTVVVSNVVQALKKIRGRGNIIIRVNMADLKLTTEHKKRFIDMVEGAASLQIMEDSGVDPGGCVVETEFGEIDARIASQLAELEQKILEMSPIKARPKAAPAEGA
ncbi:MAG: flagellar assembly protein FliH [Treponema sp.]|jgi:flagellar assembly protein FliH|nr:flagellar assembly protein FliH [Treponema sp.]